MRQITMRENTAIWSEIKTPLKSRQKVWNYLFKQVKTHLIYINTPSRLKKFQK